MDDLEQTRIGGLDIEEMQKRWQGKGIEYDDAENLMAEVISLRTKMQEQSGHLSSLEKEKARLEARVTMFKEHFLLTANERDVARRESETRLRAFKRMRKLADFWKQQVNPSDVPGIISERERLAGMYRLLLALCESIGDTSVWSACEEHSQYRFEVH